jgi:hypothetical protein
MLAATHAGRLVAVARHERRRAEALYASVTVHEDRRGGAAVLAAQAIFAAAAAALKTDR